MTSIGSEEDYNLRAKLIASGLRLTLSNSNVIIFINCHLG